MDVTLSERSYCLLREKLKAGEFRPGQRLVNRNLAQEFGVSVIPVREAINRLASEGLVQQIPGAGAFVRSPDEAELRELRIFRQCIESSAATEAARHISYRELEELEGMLEHWSQLVEKIAATARGRAIGSQMARWMRLEERFHGRIVEASRNRFLVDAVRSRRLLARVFAAVRRKAGLSPTEATITLERHWVLLKQLASRGPEAARQGMLKHLEEVTQP